MVDWITVSPNSGEGDSTVEITVENNSTTSERETALTISTEAKDIDIIIKQKGLDDSNMRALIIDLSKSNSVLTGESPIDIPNDEVDIIWNGNRTSGITGKIVFSNLTTYLKNMATNNNISVYIYINAGTSQLPMYTLIPASVVYQGSLDTSDLENLYITCAAAHVVGNTQLMLILNVRGISNPYTLYKNN